MVWIFKQGTMKVHPQLIELMASGGGNWTLNYEESEAYKDACYLLREGM